MTSFARRTSPSHNQTDYSLVWVKTNPMNRITNASKLMALAEWATTEPYIAEIIHNTRRPDQKVEYDIEDHHEDTDKFES